MSLEKTRDRVRDWMLWAGLSQTDLAEKIGTSGSAVSRILGGSRVASLRTAVALEAAMREPRHDGRTYAKRAVEPRDWERGRR